MFFVASNSLRLFCVIVVVFKNVVRGVRIFMLFDSFVSSCLVCSVCQVFGLFCLSGCSKLL